MDQTIVSELKKCIICNQVDCDLSWKTGNAHSKCIELKFQKTNIKKHKIKLQHDEDISFPPFLR